MHLDPGTARERRQHAPPTLPSVWSFHSSILAQRMVVALWGHGDGAKHATTCPPKTKDVSVSSTFAQMRVFPNLFLFYFFSFSHARSSRSCRSHTHTRSSRSCHTHTHTHPHHARLPHTHTHAPHARVTPTHTHPLLALVSLTHTHAHHARVAHTHTRSSRSCRSHTHTLLTLVHSHTHTLLTLVSLTHTLITLVSLTHTHTHARICTNAKIRKIRKISKS